MHAGNLGLFVELEDLRKGRLSLAPLYDMLPMRWRPDPNLGGAPDYAAFDLDAASATGPARKPAQEFWVRLAANERVSAALRQVAGDMAQRLSVATPAARVKISAAL